MDTFYKGGMISLGLGTAQLGIQYGNKSHAPVMTKENAFSILEAATKNQIKYFDTAINYGASEDILGEYFSNSRFERIFLTKIPHCTHSIWGSENLFYEFVLENIEKSKLRLKIDKHQILQFHHLSYAHKEDYLDL
jgi:aryl-alcohol dehydrogenase-like predicted oxidoreductase